MSKYGGEIRILNRGIYLSCDENPKMLHFEHGGLFIPPLYIDNCLEFEFDAELQAVLDKWYKDGKPNAEYISARLQESYAALRQQDSNRERKARKQKVCRRQSSRRKVFRKCRGHQVHL